MRTRNVRFLVFRYLRQRRRLLYHTVQTLNPTYIMLLDRFASREVSTRRFWSLPRPQNWFSVLLLRRDLDFWWRQNFRVNRDTFMNIVEIVRPSMTTEDNNFRTATPIEKKVAAALWRLANGQCYRSIGITLGLGTSSVRLYTQQFCDIICESRKEFIKLPSTYELPSIIEKFSEKTKIPNVVGTIDGSHIPIKAPEVYKENYFNRKHRYSVLLQGVVGPDLQFFYVFVGVPGSVTTPGFYASVNLVRTWNPRKYCRSLNLPSKEWR